MDTLILRIAIFALYFMLSNKAIADEPKCYSRFDYDKKMIEEMIRAEIKQEEFAKRMDLNDGRVGDLRTDLLNEIQSAKERMVEAEIKLQECAKRLDLNDKTLGDLRTDFHNKIQSTKEDISMDMNDFIQKHIANTTGDDEKIAFSAKLGSSISSTSSGQTIVFDAITVHHGNGYSPSTGQFTAPQGGTYQFSFSMMIYTPSSSRTHCNFYLVKGFTGVVYSRSDTHSVKNVFSQSSINYIIDLTKGEHVYVKSESAGCYVHAAPFTFFSGISLF